jgi:hypothetical protein
MSQNKIEEVLTRASLPTSLFSPVAGIRKVACATKKRKSVNGEDILILIISIG